MDPWLFVVCCGDEEDIDVAADDPAGLKKNQSGKYHHSDVSFGGGLVECKDDREESAVLRRWRSSFRIIVMKEMRREETKM